MLADRFLAAPEFCERHEITIAAAAPAVWSAIEEMDAREPRAARLLYAARNFIGRLRNGHAQKDLSGEAFTPLAEDPPHEAVRGIVGQWWRFGAAENRRMADAAAFLAFTEPGYAKATFGFRLESLGDGRTRLSTETRVSTTDAATRRMMGRYWLLIRPFSGLIRRIMLAAIRRRAEAP